FQDAATRAAVWAAQGETPPAEVLALGRQVRAEEQAKVEDQVAQLLKAPMRKVSDLTEQLRRLPGYDYQQDPDTKRSQLRHLETGSRFALGELKPGGVPLKQAYEQAVQRTQQRDLVRSREQSRDGGMSI
ncbi:hypothetical protein, partial [Hymenobacter profundi]